MSQPHPAWFALALSLAFAVPAFAQSTPADQAREHFDRGLEFFDEGRYDAALAEFQRAYELAPAHQALYNLGRVHAAMGHAVEAARVFEQYLGEAGDDVPSARRREVRDALERQRARIGHVEVTCNVPGATLSVDGVDITTLPTRPVAVSAGTHVVSVRAPGFDTTVVSVQVAGGERRPVAVELQRFVSPVGTLRVTSPLQDVRVRVDGEHVGTTPLDRTIPVDEGEHHVTGERPGYLTARETVVVADASEVAVRLQLEPDPHPDPLTIGILALQLPDAPYVLRVNGEPMPGELSRVPLPAGRHEVILDVAEREPFEQEIRIEAGRNLELAPQLTWTPAAKAERVEAAEARRGSGQILVYTTSPLFFASVGLLAWNEHEIRATDDRIAELTEMCMRDACGEGDPRVQEARRLEDKQPLQNALRGITIGVGLATALGAIVGAVLWGGAATEREIDESASASRARVDVGPGGATVRW